jgi:hypothetical protein
MRSVCPFTQWKLNAIPLHHHTVRSWIVTIRSQLHFVLWKILPVFGLLAAVTAIHYRIRTVRIVYLWYLRVIMCPELPFRLLYFRVLIGMKSSATGFCHPVRLHEGDSTYPSVAMIRSAGSFKSNCSGVGSAGMSPVSL